MTALRKPRTLAKLGGVLGPCLLVDEKYAVGTSRKLGLGDFVTRHDDPRALDGRSFKRALARVLGRASMYCIWHRPSGYIVTAYEGPGGPAFGSGVRYFPALPTAPPTFKEIMARERVQHDAAMRSRSSSKAYHALAVQRDALDRKSKSLKGAKAQEEHFKALGRIRREMEAICLEETLARGHRWSTRAYAALVGRLEALSRRMPGLEDARARKDYATARARICEQLEAICSLRLAEIERELHELCFNSEAVMRTMGTDRYFQKRHRLEREKARLDTPPEVFAVARTLAELVIGSFSARRSSPEDR